MDQIFLKDLRLHTIIGVNANERLISQEILVNIIMFSDTHAAAISDNLQDCVDYSLVANRIKEEVVSLKRFTVEALADDIARTCLENSAVHKVIVRVEKPSAIPYAQSVGVEIERP